MKTFLIYTVKPYDLGTVDKYLSSCLTANWPLVQNTPTHPALTAIEKILKSLFGHSLTAFMVTLPSLKSNTLMFLKQKTFATDYRNKSLKKISKDTKNFHYKVHFEHPNIFIKIPKSWYEANT